MAMRNTIMFGTTERRYLIHRGKMADTTKLQQELDNKIAAMAEIMDSVSMLQLDIESLFAAIEAE